MLRRRPALIPLALLHFAVVPARSPLLSRKGQGGGCLAQESKPDEVKMCIVRLCRLPDAPPSQYCSSRTCGEPCWLTFPWSPCGGASESNRGSHLMVFTADHNHSTRSAYNTQFLGSFNGN